jgi:hypothetical protein
MIAVGAKVTDFEGIVDVESGVWKTIMGFLWKDF